jgi:hypothetical protein
MSPFWSSFFGHLRDCGRNGNLFVFGLAGFLGILAFAIAVSKTELLKSVLPLLPGLGLLVMVWVCVAIRRARVRRRERLHRSPLSDDELRVARSKLRKSRG